MIKILYEPRRIGYLKDCNQLFRCLKGGNEPNIRCLVPLGEIKIF